MSCQRWSAGYGRKLINTGKPRALPGAPKGLTYAAVGNNFDQNVILDSVKSSRWLLTRNYAPFKQGATKKRTLNAPLLTGLGIEDFFQRIRIQNTHVALFDFNNAIFTEF